METCLFIKRKDESEYAKIYIFDNISTDLVAQFSLKIENGLWTIYNCSICNTWIAQHYVEYSSKILKLVNESEVD